MQIDINLVLFLMISLILFLAALIFMGGLVIYNWQRSKSQRLPQPKAKLSQSTFQPSEPEPVATQIYQGSEDTKPVRIILGEIDNPFGEITRYQKSGSDSYEDIRLDEKTLIGISSWFQQAPNLVQSGAQILSNTYTLTFRPEIAKGLADGSLRTMQSLDGGLRAIAVDGNNVVRGAGSLNLASGLKSIASVAAVWQVLATITAQKFLANIDRQLVKINKKLEGIKNFLEYEQYAKLVGSLKYVEEFRDVLNSQSFENLEFGVFLNKLEDIEQECTQIMVTLELEMDDVHDFSSEQPLEAIFNIQDNFEALRDSITNYERLSQTYLIAVAVKCLAYQTRFAIPSNHYLTLERLSNLQTELSTWDENQQEFFQLVDKRLPELSSWIDDGEEKQMQLKQVIARRKDSLAQKSQDIQELVSETESNIRGYLQDTLQPLSWVVELNQDSQIIKARKLLKKNNEPVDIMEKEH